MTACDSMRVPISQHSVIHRMPDVNQSPRDPTAMSEKVKGTEIRSHIKVRQPSVYKHGMECIRTHTPNPTVSPMGMPEGKGWKLQGQTETK